MPVSSEWKAAWQSALDEMAAAKAAHTPFERAVTDAQQALSEARRTAKDMERDAREECKRLLAEARRTAKDMERDARDECKRLLADIRERASAEEADARQMLTDAQESAKYLTQSATDELEDAHRRAEHTDQRVAEATAAYTQINYSKPQFSGSWDAAKGAGAFANARLAAPTAGHARSGRGYRGVSAEQQMQRNAEVHKQRQDGGVAARDHEADLEWLRTASADSEDSSLTHDLDAELAALQHSMDQEADEQAS